MKPQLLISAVAALLLVTIRMPAQEIFEAINSNDIGRVKVLVAKDTTLLNVRDKVGNTPLHQAVISGSVPITEFLIEKGADLNAINTQSITPLITAITNGKDDVSKVLIKKGADIGKTVERNTPLHFAAWNNRTAIVKLLIDRGSDIESKNKLGYTPLGHIARSGGKFESARLLIRKGADINAKDPLGQTPLNNAIMYNEDNKTIDLLLDHHADVDTSLQSLTDMLTSACQRGHIRLFTFIAERGGEGLFGNEATNRILMRSAMVGGSLEIVKMLQSRKIPLNLSANSNGLTPLHGAAGNPDANGMIEFLVNNGADINARTHDGRSAYNVAEANGNKKGMDLILKLGGNAEPQKFPELTGPYMGQIPPGNEQKRFAPGIVSLDHGTITASPDGKELFWGTGKSILTSKIQDGKWTIPGYAPFSGPSDIDFYDDVPFITPDNKKLFFTSKRPLGSATRTKENIWFVERTSEGWSDPEAVSDEVNGMGLHWQVSVSNSGTLYFSGSSPDGYGGGDIYYSKLVNGEYTKPVNAGPVINSKEGETMPYISPDESYLIYYKVILQRPSLYISFRAKDGQWLEAKKIDQISPYVGAIVTPDGKYLFFYNQWVSAAFIQEMRPKEKPVTID